MKTNRTLGLVALGAAGMVLAVLCGVPAQSQAAASFTDNLDQNVIRSSLTKVHSSVRQAYLFDGNETSASKKELSREYAMQEYVAAAGGGRPTKLLRSYDQIQGTDKLWITADGDPVETPAVDGRSRHTFVFNVDPSGNCKLAEEAMQLVEAKDIHAAATDHTPRLAPAGEAQAGATWQVSAADFGFAGVMGVEEKMSETSVSVTFDETRKDDAGRALAWLSYTASIKSGYRTVNEFDGSETANFSVEYEIQGKAAYLVGGHIMALTSTGTCKAKGKAGGMDCTIEVSWTMSRDFAYGALVDASADNGSEGPNEVSDLYTAKTGAVAANEIVIARAGSISRIQSFDPAARKISKTLAALPKGYNFNELALSPDRKRIAFRSNGNSTISIAEANVFVLELESGVVNQITPSWATNEGITKPLDTGKTVTVTGRLVWFDDEKRIDRTDGLYVGWVRVDHTACFSKIDGTTGKFRLENVPANTSIFIHAYASLPNYTNGKSRGYRFLPDGKAMAATVLLTGDSDKDIGDLKISPPAVEHGYGSPSFAKGGDVVCNRYPGSTVAIVGYPKRTWKEQEVDANLGLLTGAMAVSPDARMLSFVTDSSGGKGSLHFYDSRGKEVWGTALAEGVEVSFSSQGAWLADGSGWVCTAGAPGWLGKARFGLPGLLYAAPAQKQVTFARKWPQLGGYTCKSVALNKEGTVAYLVFHFTDEKGVTYGDLWQWDSTTDTLSRLTNLGDVLGVANIGR